MIREVEKESRFGPDLLVKTWVDLDRVFFAGRLRGHVLVRWVERLEDDDLMGYTNYRSSDHGKCWIRISTDRFI